MYSLFHVVLDAGPLSSLGHWNHVNLRYFDWNFSYLTTATNIKSRVRDVAITSNIVTMLLFSPFQSKAEHEDKCLQTWNGCSLASPCSRNWNIWLWMKCQTEEVLLQIETFYAANFPNILQNVQFLFSNLWATRSE